MLNEQEEIEILRQIIKEKDQLIDAYKKQLALKNLRIEMLEQAIGSYKEAGDRLSQIGENPLDYPIECSGDFNG